MLTKKQICDTIIEDADRVTFRIDGTKIGTYTYAELYGKRISIEYQAETQEDAEVLDLYGSLFDAPAYLVSMIPIIKLDGEEVARGKAVILGSEQVFSMELYSCGFTTHVNNAITAGSMYHVTLDGQSITGKELQSTYDEAVAMSETATLENVYSEEYLGNLLDVVGKLYFAQLDIMNNIAGEMCDVVQTRNLSEGMTGYQVQTSSLYGSPVAVREGSFFIDIDYDSHGAASINGRKEDEIHFMKTSGMLSSLCESLVWEELTGVESVSTMTVLQTASSQGNQLLVINENNFEEMSGRVQASSAALADVEKAVRSGKEVTIPEKEVTMGEWVGTGYILMDPATGVGVYRISGGLTEGSEENHNGGTVTGIVTVEAVLGTMLLLADMVQLVFALASLVCVTSTLGFFVALIVDLTLLVCAVFQFGRMADLYIRYMNGDLEAGEQIVTETMLNASLNLIAIRVSRILSKYSDAIRGKWKDSKLYKKIKELFGDVADDMVPGEGDGGNSGTTGEAGSGSGSESGNVGGGSSGDGGASGETGSDSGGLEIEGGSKTTYKILNTSSAEDVNKILKDTMGYEPPYKPGTSVTEIQLTENATYVRVYDKVNSRMQGGWVMKAEDIAGLTPQEIQNKFALPNTPKYICDVNLEAGTRLRTGEVNPLFGFDGGGQQYDLIINGKNVGTYTNERIIGQ